MSYDDNNKPTEATEGQPTPEATTGEDQSATTTDTTVEADAANA